MPWNCFFLGALQKGDLGVSYSYNSDGLRVSKIVNGVKTEYVWDGSSLIGQKTGNNVLVYLYAADGLAGFQYNGVNYYYLKNGQGDVVGILNSSGTLVAKYTYDAWGKLLSVTDAAGNDKSADASFIGNINPIRYRSYYYDTETGLYYLQSRYYDPEVGRFINADSVMGVNRDIYTYNLFTYCGNNPINRWEFAGQNWLDNFLRLFMTREQRRSTDNYNYGTPIYGEPNSWLHIPGNNGNDVDRRFGPDGRAAYDIHWGHPDNHPDVGSPHREDWDWSNEKHPRPDPGSARPYDPERDGVPPGAPVPPSKFEFKLPQFSFNPPTGDDSFIFKFFDGVKSFFNKLFG